MFLLCGVLSLWYRDRENLKKTLGVSQSPKTSWSIDQILGAPDTPLPGDFQTAWASKTQDAGKERIILEYPRIQTVSAIWVYETYNPGALIQIDTVNANGGTKTVWHGRDPTGAGSAIGISKIKLDKPVTSRRIRIVLDTQNFPGWNEIDAVAILGADGKKQFATNAWASSSFGDNRDKPAWFWP